MNNRENREKTAQIKWLKYSSAEILDWRSDEKSKLSIYILEKRRQINVHLFLHQIIHSLSADGVGSSRTTAGCTSLCQFFVSECDPRDQVFGG